MFTVTGDMDRAGFRWLRRASATGVARSSGKPVGHLGGSVVGDVRIDGKRALLPFPRFFRPVA